MSCVLIGHQLAAQAARPAAPVAPLGALPVGSHSVTRSIAQLGFANGLSFDGAGERTVAFRLPAPARTQNARLILGVRFSPQAVAESNVQVLAGGRRLAVITRAQADTSGRWQITVSVPRELLAADYLTLTVRANTEVVRDRCVDQQLGLGFVEIDPDSRLVYDRPAGAEETVRGIWTDLPDTVSIALPNRKLTEEEFAVALGANRALLRDGRVARYVTPDARPDILLGTRAEVSAFPGATSDSAPHGLAVFHWSDTTARASLALIPSGAPAGTDMLARAWSALLAGPGFDVRVARAEWRAPEDDPSLADLGVTDLHRDVGAEAIWVIPIDLRDMPPGRAPARVDLRVVTAPNTHDRDLLLFAYLNGVLVRSYDIAADGLEHVIDVGLPSSLLVPRNELRISLQRHITVSADCVGRDAAISAQIAPASRVITKKADRNASVFTAVTAQLRDGDPLYLPAAALNTPARYLELAGALERAFWNGQRVPKLVFYSAAPTAPTGAFVLIGRPPGIPIEGPLTADSGRLVIHPKGSTTAILDIADLRDWSSAQVVTWNKRTGVQLLPAENVARIPDWPEAYGNSTLMITQGDSTPFQLNTAGRDGSLLFNDGPTLLDKIRLDWYAWALFALLLLAWPLVYSVRTIVRRTPRRALPARVDRPGQRSDPKG